VQSFCETFGNYWFLKGTEIRMNSLGYLSDLSALWWET